MLETKQQVQTQRTNNKQKHIAYFLKKKTHTHTHTHPPFEAYVKTFRTLGGTVEAVSTMTEIFAFQAEKSKGFVSFDWCLPGVF